MRAMSDLWGNPHCDFCARMKFERGLLQDQLEKYEKKSHVKGNFAYQGIVLTNYIMDHRKMVYEKRTRIYSKVRFCPICGYDYVRHEKYTGKQYKNMTINHPRILKDK